MAIRRENGKIQKQSYQDIIAGILESVIAGLKITDMMDINGVSYKLLNDYVNSLL